MHAGAAASRVEPTGEHGLVARGRVPEFLPSGTLLDDTQPLNGEEAGCG